MADQNVTHLEAFLDFQSNHADMFKEFETAGDRTIEAIEKGLNKAIGGLRGTGTDTIETFKEVAKSIGLFKADIEDIRSDNLKEPLSGFQDKDIVLMKDFNKQLENVKENVDLKNKGHKLQNKLLETDLGLISDQADSMEEINQLINDQNKLRKDGLDVSRKAYNIAWMMVDAIWAADQATQNFITTNFRMYGSQYQLTQQALELAAATGQTTDKALEAVAALSNLATPKEQMKDLSETILEANTYLGVGIGELAEFSRQNRFAGGDVKSFNRIIGYSADAMKTYGLNSSDVGRILGDTTISMFDLYMSMGQFGTRTKDEAGKFLTSMELMKKAQLSFEGMAKRMGFAAGVGASAIAALANPKNITSIRMMAEELGIAINGSEDLLASLPAITSGMLGALDINLDMIKAFKTNAAGGEALSNYVQSIMDRTGLAKDQVILMLEIAEEMKAAGKDVKNFAQVEEYMKAKNAAEAYKEAMKTLTGQVGLIVNKLNAFANMINVVIGQGLMEWMETLQPLFDVMTKSISRVVKGIKDFAAKNPGAAKTIRMIASALLVVVIALTTFSAVSKAAAAANTLLGLSFKMSPIGAFIALVIALAASLVYLYENFEDVRYVVDKLNNYFFYFRQNLERVVEIMQPVIDFTKQYFHYLVENLSGANGSLAQFSSVIASLAIGAFILRIGKIGKVFSKFKGWIAPGKKSIDQFSAFTKQKGGLISSTFTKIGEALKGVFKGIIDGIIYVIGKLGDMLKAVFDALAKVADGVGKVMKNLVKRLTPKDIAAYIGLGVAFYIVALAAEKFAQAAQLVAADLGPMLVAMSALVVMLGLMGAMIVGFGKMAQGSFVGIAIFIGAMFALSLIALIVAKAFQILAPPLNSIIDTLSNASGRAILSSGLALSLVLATLGIVGAAVFMPLIWLAGALVVFSAALQLFGQATQANMPLIDKFIVFVNNVLVGVFDILTKAIDAAERVITKIVDAMTSMFTTLMTAGDIDVMAIVALGAAIFAFSIEGALAVPGLMALSTALHYLEPKITSIVETMQKYAALPPGLMMSMVNDFAAASKMMDSVGTTIKGAFSAAGEAISGFFSSAEPADLFQQVNMLGQVGNALKISSMNILVGAVNLAKSSAVLVGSGLMQAMEQIKDFSTTISSKINITPFVSSMAALVLALGFLAPSMVAAGEDLRNSNESLISAFGAIAPSMFTAGDDLYVSTEYLATAMRSISPSIVAAGDDLQVSTEYLAAAIRSIAPSMVIAGDNLQISTDYLTSALGSIAPSVAVVGESLEQSVAQVINPIDSITTAIQNLNEAIIELTGNSLTNLSRLGPALQGIFERGISSVKAETINTVQMTTDSDGGAYNTPDKKDPMKMVVDKLDAIKQQDLELNTKMLALMDAQLSEMRNRSNISTSYNAWVS